MIVEKSVQVKREKIFQYAVRNIYILLQVTIHILNLPITFQKTDTPSVK
jgi:hypothetical protein